MKSKNLLSILIFFVLFFSAISICSAAQENDKTLEPSEVKQESKSLEVTTKPSDKYTTWYIYNMILGYRTTAEIANGLYGKYDLEHNHKVISEMERLEFPRMYINRALKTVNSTSLPPATEDSLYYPNNNTASSDNVNDSFSLNKGVIYIGSKSVGIWNGKDAYTLNSAGKLVKSSSYTVHVNQAITNNQTKNTTISSTATFKIVKFVNNVASNKVVNSAVYSLARLDIKQNKSTLSFKLLTNDIINSNLGAKEFTKNNVYLSTNALKNVLNNDVSKKYIARRNVKVNNLKNILSKGKAVLRVKNIKDNTWKYIAISKVSNKKVTVYDNKKSQKIDVKSLVSHMKKYKFSGVAITYNVKAGKTPSNTYLKGVTGI
jgi:hypothetical protein